MKKVKLTEIEEKNKELLLETKDKYDLIERQYKVNNGGVELIYSHYIIKNRGKPLMTFGVPKPFGKTHPKGTDAFLLYQDRTRPLMRDIFKILTKQQDSLSDNYVAADDSSLEVKEQGDLAAFYLKGTEFQVGGVRLEDIEKSKMLAQNFIDAFDTQNLSYPWDEVFSES